MKAAAEILIREGADADADAVIALVDLCWSAYPGIILDVDAEEPGLRHPASHFRDENGGFWTAWEAAALRGMIGYTFDAAAKAARLRHAPRRQEPEPAPARGDIA